MDYGRDFDRVGVVFDDESLVADAGLLTAVTLMNRLGLKELVDRVVRLGDRRGAANAGCKVLDVGRFDDGGWFTY